MPFAWFWLVLARVVRDVLCHLRGFGYSEVEANYSEVESKAKLSQDQASSSSSSRSRSSSSCSSSSSSRSIYIYMHEADGALPRGPAAGSPPRPGRRQSPEARPPFVCFWVVVASRGSPGPPPLSPVRRLCHRGGGFAPPRGGVSPHEALPQRRRLCPRGGVFPHEVLPHRRRLCPTGGFVPSSLLLLLVLSLSWTIKKH